MSNRNWQTQTVINNYYHNNYQFEKYPSLSNEDLAKKLAKLHQDKIVHSVPFGILADILHNANAQTDWLDVVTSLRKKV